MKRLLVALATALCLIGLTAGAASAANPHFIRASASGPNNAGNVTVTFKIAGLGSTVSTTVTASADVSAVYACKNNGNNFPSDPKKTEVTGTVEVSGPFTSGKNGQINGSLTLTPPASTLSCPPGQQMVLVSVSYTNVQVSEPSAGSYPIAGTFSRVFYNI